MTQCPPKYVPVLEHPPPPPDLFRYTLNAVVARIIRDKFNLFVVNRLRAALSSSSIQFQSGFLLVPEGSQLHLIPSAIALTPSLHLVRSTASSIFNTTFSTLSSTCLFHAAPYVPPPHGKILPPRAAPHGKNSA